MTKTNLQKWAEEKGERAGFKSKEKIYEASYYETGKIRNVILAGDWEGRPSVLKAYDDPRLCDEPLSLKNFNKNNKSSKLIAPKLYEYEIITPKKGWFIMEELPKTAKPFKSPLGPNERKDFLKSFVEYRKNFPNKPHRELTLKEKLPASEFHVHRINSWLSLANDKEENNYINGAGKVLDPKEFIPRYKTGLDLIRREFKGREMVWCHGHVKPKEIFCDSETGKMYLTDFAHSQMYPEGYELAFIIWSDHIMEADWRQSYSDWRKGVFSWVEDLRPVAEELGVKNYDNFIKYCLIERILGTILADITASDKPKEKKEVRLNLLYKLFDELIY